MPNLYCFDTNVIFDIWKEDKGKYPKDILQGLWQHFNKLVDDGFMFSIKDVYLELMNEEKEEKAFKTWLKDHKSIFKEIDENTMKEVETLTGKYPLLSSGYGNAADPVIACYSKVHSHIVFTTENNPANSSPTQPRLPNLCNELNIQCIGVWDFCRMENLQFKL